MYKKRNLMLLAILLLSLILAACGATTPTAAPTVAPTTAPTAVATTAPTVNTTPIPTATLAPTKVAQLEPKGGTWKTWLITDGKQFRQPAPPDKAATEAEIKQLKDMMAQRDSLALEKIAYWNAGSPSHRWNEMLVTYALKNNLGINMAARHMALFHTGLYDSMVAAWDSKYTYNRLRPSEVDASLTTVIPNPAYPAYPSEQAVAAGYSAAVLGYIFPNDAAFFNQQAEEAVKSRLLAGVDYPSDIKAGLELGRSIANVTIERGKADGSGAKWTGSVPTEAGKWTGTNPAVPTAGSWKTWVLSAGNEFRPDAPPAFDSAQIQAELAELKEIQSKRTPKQNADAFFWEYGAGGLRVYQFWNDHATKKIFEYKLDQNPLRAARVYALQSVALHDVGVACWDAKYTYWAMRPAMMDKDFKPVFNAPNHPSYPSAHSCFSTAQAFTLSYLFPQEATTFKGLADTAGESRLWAGIHFRSDITAGDTLAQKVSQKLIERAKIDGSQS
jgi:membrane-associated phospholipid phosphatase